MWSLEKLLSLEKDTEKWDEPDSLEPQRLFQSPRNPSVSGGKSWSERVGATLAALE